MAVHESLGGYTRVIYLSREETVEMIKGLVSQLSGVASVESSQAEITVTEKGFFKYNLHLAVKE